MEERFTARMLVDYAAKQRGVAIEDFGVAPVVVLSWARRTVQSLAKTYRRQGVLGVDMETSAMYALGQVRGADVCNLLVVSDELWREWHPAFGQPALLEAMQRAERAILRCVSVELAG